MLRTSHRYICELKMEKHYKRISCGTAKFSHGICSGISKFWHLQDQRTKTLSNWKSQKCVYRSDYVFHYEKKSEEKQKQISCFQLPNTKAVGQLKLENSCIVTLMRTKLPTGFLTGLYYPQCHCRQELWSIIWMTGRITVMGALTKLLPWKAITNEEKETRTHTNNFLKAKLKVLPRNSVNFWSLK